MKLTYDVSQERKVKMKKTKAFVSILLVLLLVFSLTACGGGAAKPKDGGDAKSGDEKITFRLGLTGHLGGFLEGLTPMECHTACRAVYDAVFRIDPYTKQVVSDCLDDWYWDGNYFIMKLHDGVIFNNGQKATSEDLYFSYYNHYERGSNYLTSMNIDWDKTEIRDEFTVAFYCTTPNRSITETVIHLNCKSFADEVGSYDSEKWYYPVTSGPYKVVDYAYDDHITLELRDDYWKRSADEYYIDKYEITYYADAASLYMELELGNLDLCEILPADYARYMADKDDSRKFNVYLDSTGACIFLNFGYRDNDIWFNKDLRTAIAYGVNWPELGQAVMTDLYKPANSFIPSDSPFYFDAGSWEYSPEKAKEYLEKAGYGPGELTIHGTCMDTPKYKAYGQSITYYLTNMGINVDLQYADVSAAIANWLVQGNNDMMMKYNSGGAPQYNMYISCQESAWEQGVSWTYIVDDKYQAMFDDLENPLNSFERQVEIEKEMQKYVHDEVLMVPICEYTMAFGYNSELLTPEIVDPITMGVAYQLQILGLKSTWGK